MMSQCFFLSKTPKSLIGLRLYITVLQIDALTFFSEFKNVFFSVAVMLLVINDGPDVFLCNLIACAAVYDFVFVYLI